MTDSPLIGEPLATAVFWTKRQHLAVWDFFSIIYLSIRLSIVICKQIMQIMLVGGVTNIFW
jgi:hypothetical protein